MVTPNNLEQRVGELLQVGRKTFAAVESCTGGLILHRMTNIPGSSDYVLGGFVTYSNEAKMKFVNVQATTLAQFGAVSSQTAREMAVRAECHRDCRAGRGHGDQTCWSCLHRDRWPKCGRGARVSLVGHPRGKQTAHGGCRAEAALGLSGEIPMNPQGHVLVLGGAGLDAKGRPLVPLQAETSNPGGIRFSFGGVARNIAENLARLDVPTVLLTALGDDPPGHLILNHCLGAGIDMSHALILPGERSSSYIAVLDHHGDLSVAVSDYSMAANITPDILLDRESLFRDAAMIALDANLSEDALRTIFDMAEAHDVPICADPTSVPLAGKLCAYLDRVYMIAPNASETTALCGLSNPATDTETAVKAARFLVSLGTEVAIVTLGELGLSYADRSGSGHIPAVRTHVIDATGAGDALTAGVIFGLLNGISIDEAVRLGVSAATLTIQSSESVLPELTQELLYDQLII
jgi:pseudouridine kinase